MTSSARLDDLQQKFAADPRRYFAPLANEFRKRGDAGRAVELCRAHLPQQPGHLSGHVVLAQALHDLEQRDAARQAYEDALALDPENVLVLRCLGDLAREGGDAAMARGWYDRAMGLDPRDPDIAQRVAALEQMPPHAPAPTAMGFTAALVAANARHEAAGDPGAGPDTLVEPEVTGGPLERSDDLVEEVSEVAGADRAEADDQREAADFTAGFFAAVLEEPPVAASAPATDESDAPRPTDDPQASDDQAPTPSSADADEIDRLFDEMPPLFADADLAQRDEPGPVASLPIGTELAILDGGAIVPDVPSTDDLLDQWNVDVGGPDVPPPSFEAAPLVPDEGPVPLVADEEPQTLDDLGAEYFIDMPAVAADDESVDRVDDPSHDAPTAGPDVAPANVPDAPSDEDASESIDAAGTGDDVTLEFVPQHAEQPVRDSSVTYTDEVHEDAGDAPFADAPAAFVTETMAELYLRQGFPEQALSVYRQLAAQRPDDVRLTERVKELSREAAAAVEASAAPPVVTADRPSEPVAVSWLRRLAVARPTPVATPIATPVSTPVSTPMAEPPAPATEAPAELEPAAEEPAVVAAFEWARPAAEAEADGAVDAVSGESAESGESDAREDPLSEEEPVDLQEPVELQAPTTVEQPDAIEEPAEDAHQIESPAPVESAPVEVAAQTFEPGHDAGELDDPWVFDGELMSGASSYAPMPASPTGQEGGHERAAADEPDAATAQYQTVTDDAVPTAASAPPPAAATLEEILARPAAEQDEVAAGALVAATLSFQADPAVDAMLAESVAEDPGALQHTLRATPRSVAALRQGASFSFEQFFRPEDARPSGEQPGAPRATASAEPAPSSAPDEEAARDLAEFHAWLAGLGDS